MPADNVDPPGATGGSPASVNNATPAADSAATSSDGSTSPRLDDAATPTAPVSLAEMRTRLAAIIDEELGRFDDAPPGDWSPRAYLLAMGLLCCQLAHDDLSVPQLTGIVRTLGAQSRAAVRDSHPNDPSAPELDMDEFHATVRVLYGVDLNRPGPDAAAPIADRTADQRRDSDAADPAAQAGSTQAAPTAPADPRDPRARIAAALDRKLGSFLNVSPRHWSRRAYLFAIGLLCHKLTQEDLSVPHLTSIVRTLGAQFRAARKRSGLPDIPEPRTDTEFRRTVRGLYGLHHDGATAPQPPTESPADVPGRAPADAGAATRDPQVRESRLPLTSPRDVKSLAPTPPSSDSLLSAAPPKPPTKRPRPFDPDDRPSKPLFERNERRALHTWAVSAPRMTGYDPSAPMSYSTPRRVVEDPFAHFYRPSATDDATPARAPPPDDPLADKT